MDILNQFGVQPILLAAQVVNFIILLFILKRFLYKPILKVLDERKKKIEDSLKNAEEIERKLQETEEQADKILKKALDEAQRILDDSKTAAAQVIDEGHKAASQIINKANEEAVKIIQVERLKLQREIRENTSNLVSLIFEKVIGKKVNLKDQKELIEKEIENIS